jgi:hypothetical protein
MHIENYSAYLKSQGKEDLATAVEATVDEVVPKYIRNFSYNEHVVSLLLGNVQSGKTSHMFALIAAAADEGFNIFVLLTTDNIYLQQQTLKRAQESLVTFDIFGEEDYLKFSKSNLKNPALIVLKKNGRILKQWKNNFASTNFCAGNPLFIVDDEADAASLNTLVNKRRESTIYKTLAEIKNTSSSSIYMQVTGTPQAIILQTKSSGSTPLFVHYFKPGKDYLGGDFFFSQNDDNPYVVITDGAEAQNLMADDELVENNLKFALLIHLIAAAHIFLSKSDTVCNFMIHPSVRITGHEKFAEKIGGYLNDLSSCIDEPEVINALKDAYQNLLQTKSNLVDFDFVYDFIASKLQSDEISIKIMNSHSDFASARSFNEGINIIIGGNSLGRGLTFPKLQTVYYCRQSKNPQADTVWQHSRIFGYDRDFGLVRVFMPPLLFKLFSDLNRINTALISQVIKHFSVQDLCLYYPVGIRPTRPQVIDNLALSIVTGGVNYFPFEPTNNTIEDLDGILKPFGETGMYPVSLKLIINILKYTGCQTDDWDNESFISFITAYIADKPSEQGFLIVRRDRDIAKGTGTLLSPNDRTLGQAVTDKVVLTMYKVTGSKGWNGEKIWIPNIKFPDDLMFYNVN